MQVWVAGLPVTVEGAKSGSGLDSQRPILKTGWGDHDFSFRRPNDNKFVSSSFFPIWQTLLVSSPCFTSSSQMTKPGVMENTDVMLLVGSIPMRVI